MEELKSYSHWNPVCETCGWHRHEDIHGDVYCFSSCIDDQAHCTWGPFEPKYYEGKKVIIRKSWGPKEDLGAIIEVHIAKYYKPPTPKDEIKDFGPFPYVYYL